MNINDLIQSAGGVGKLAAQLGVSHSTVCDWKRIGHIPGSRVLQIAESLGVPVTDIVALVRAA